MVLGKTHIRFILFAVFIGFGLVIGAIRYLPDGKLHIIFCRVGQGDGTYLRMPNGSDVLIDGGPSSEILGCLSRHMPFYDRTIDVVVLTHPQKDHLFGLISVLERYKIIQLVTVPVGNSTETFNQFIKAVGEEGAAIHYLTSGSGVQFGTVAVKVIWPLKSWLTSDLDIVAEEESLLNTAGHQVLAKTTDKDLNIYSLYLALQFGDFNALFTGDGDAQTQELMRANNLSEIIPDHIEVLKVPHHGSATAITEWFSQKVSPQLSIIEVGKNNYGHPNQPTVKKLEEYGKVLRTDQRGDIEVITDGKTWFVR